MPRNKRRRREWLCRQTKQQDTSQGSDQEGNSAPNIFTKWHSLRWVLLLGLLPLPGAGIVYCIEQQIVPVILYSSILACFGALQVQTLVTGVSKSNMGQFERKTDPFNFWRDVAIWGLAYGLFLFFPYYMLLSHQ